MGKYLSGDFPSTPLFFNYYIRDLANINDDPFSRFDPLLLSRFSLNIFYRGVTFCICNMMDNNNPIGITTLRNISSTSKSAEIGFIWFVAIADLTSTLLTYYII